MATEQDGEQEGGGKSSPASTSPCTSTIVTPTKAFSNFTTHNLQTSRSLLPGLPPHYCTLQRTQRRSADIHPQFHGGFSRWGSGVPCLEAGGSQAQCLLSGRAGGTKIWVFFWELVASRQRGSTAAPTEGTSWGAQTPPSQPPSSLTFSLAWDEVNYLKFSVFVPTSEKYTTLIFYFRGAFS